MKINNYPILILLLFAFISPMYLLSQPQKAVESCKVLSTAIAHQYNGDCKNGLAHGRGISKGVDTYEGTFKKGMPHGYGKYTWANGDHYIGEFKEGKRHGRGILTVNGQKEVETAKVRKGYWKEDEMVFEALEAKYKFHRSYNITRASAKKLDEKRDFVMINIQGTGLIENLEVQNNSGLLEVPQRARIIIRRPKFPLQVIVTYTTTNKLMDMDNKLSVVADFTLESNGNWMVSLNH